MFLLRAAVRGNAFLSSFSYALLSGIILDDHGVMTCQTHKDGAARDAREHAAAAP